MNVQLHYKIHLESRKKRWSKAQQSHLSIFIVKNTYKNKFSDIQKI